MAYQQIIQYSEDTAHVSGDKGMFNLGVRDDGRSTFTTANGEYSGFAVDFSGRQRMILDDGEGNARAAYVNSDNELMVSVGSSVLPTGAATAANQATIIGHIDGLEGLLTTIDADTSILSAAVSSNKFQVDIITAPTLTVNAHAVTNAGTFVVQENGAALTSLQLLDNAVYTDGSGTFTQGFGILGTDGTNPQAIKTDASGELQVDVLTLPNVTIGSAIPAGNNNIGDVDVASLPALPAGTNNIGDVDVLTVNGVAPAFNTGVRGATVQRVTLATDDVIAVTQSGTWNIGTITPGTGATNLAKAEDAAHASGDTGVFILSVRNDNLATTYGADQDYGPQATDANGRVMVAQKAATATLSNTAASASSVTILAANAARIGGMIVNDSSALMYIKFGSAASTTSYTVVLSGQASAPFSYYEIPAGYTGIITAIWASATGNARVTEIT